MPTPLPAVPPGTAKQMISPKEAAERLDVDRETILRWIRAGKLRASKLTPRLVRIYVADIDAMLAEHAL